MNPNDIKAKVLEDLINHMDERMVGNLKSKSPKFGMAKVDIQATDPKLADSLKDKLMGENPQDENDQEEKSESPMEMMREKQDPSMEGKESGMESDNDLARLMELYKKIK